MPGVTCGTGSTWTCSVAWRDPISEAKLRLTGTRRLVPSPSPCSGTFLKFLLYPCLRSSVICAPSLLLPDTPTPCQSLPGAFLSGQPPGHTSHSGEGTRWNECPSPGPSAGHLEGAWGVDPRCPWWSQPRNELPAASLSASLSPCLLTPASGAHLPNKLPAPMSSSQTLLPGGSRERPSSLPGMWSEALTSAGTEHRVFQHPIRSHAHPAPHVDRARRPAGPRTCPDGPVSEDRAGDRLRPALELSAESRLPCNVGKWWFVCGGGSDGGEQSPALRRAGPPTGQHGVAQAGTLHRLCVGPEELSTSLGVTALIRSSRQHSDISIAGRTPGGLSKVGGVLPHLLVRTDRKNSQLAHLCISGATSYMLCR